MLPQAWRPVLFPQALFPLSVLWVWGPLVSSSGPVFWPRAFLLALQQDKELFSFAYERNIILVSPSTLLVTLRTINNIWRYERQNRFAQEIAQRGGELHDKFVGFVESLDDVGRHLGRTQAAYETAHKRLSTGRGNLVSQAASLHKLGVKSKKELDKKLADKALDSDPDAEQLEILE